MRRILLIMAIAALFVGVLAGTATAAPKSPKGNINTGVEKVVICHVTEVSQVGAVNSPAHDDNFGWVLITIPLKAWEKEQGHQSHTSWKWGVSDQLAFYENGTWYCPGGIPR